MPIEAGRGLLHYRLVEKIGEGGMGVVWKAVDTTLDREVAIKLLPEAAAREDERLSRFEREAKLLASLHHPNIAAVYGFHEADGVRFIAMELVEGEDLAARLGRGPFSLDDAVDVARQVAEALEAAHGAGVVHRDLKPANILLTPEGHVKVLDFGLAKAFGADADVSSGSAPSISPTVTSVGSVPGVILGTAAYMSPEQARGRPVDQRTDIWAFGCILFEMLCGESPFRGDTVTDVLAAVVSRDPDWSRLPPATPRALRRLMRRCLEKDPKRRLRDAGDAGLEIAEASAGSDEGDRPVRAGRDGRASWLPWAAAAAFALVAAFALWMAMRPGAPAEPPTLFEVALPETERLPNDEWPVLALSPDGRTLVYTAVRGSVRQLYRRDFGGVEVKPIAGTENGAGPFVSPDGRWVAFFADGKLKKASMDGGAAIVICDAPNPRGGAWLQDGSIVVVPTVNTPLMRVPDVGGTPEPLTSLDAARNERSHRWPNVLPGGTSVLFTIGTHDSQGDYDGSAIGLLSLETGARQVVFEGARMAAFQAPDRLLTLRGSTLFVSTMDPGKPGPARGTTVALEGVGGDLSSGAGYFALARNDTAAWVPASAIVNESTLVLVDREGNDTPLPLPPQSYKFPRFSPDGTRIAYNIGSGRGADDDVWIYDLAGGQPVRLTFDGHSVGPIWTPDGRHVAYLKEAVGIVRKAVDGTGPSETIWGAAEPRIPNQFVPGHGALVASRLTEGLDLWVVAPDSGREPYPLLEGSSGEFAASLSPDGRFLAYTSVETGRAEIFVRSFPDLQGKWQVSTTGGTCPVWSKNGRELFFISGNTDAIAVVEVDTRQGFRAGPPRDLFRGPFETRTEPYTPFDVNARGTFVMVRRSDLAHVSRRIHVRMHWSLGSGNR